MLSAYRLRAMKLAFLALLVSAIGACGQPVVITAPSLPASAQSIAPATTVAIDCGSFSSDFADCLALVSAAAKLVDPAPEPGSRAEMSARAADMAHVTFISPEGSRRSADVISNPVGAYVAVNPTVGP
jgi:hypothetical protein